MVKLVNATIEQHLSWATDKRDNDKAGPMEQGDNGKTGQRDIGTTVKLDNGRI